MSTQVIVTNARRLSNPRLPPVVWPPSSRSSRIVPSSGRTVHTFPPAPSYPIGMGQIVDRLREALVKRQKTVSLREIARETEVDHSLLAGFVRGDRESLRLDTLQRLADYLGLELR